MTVILTKELCNKTVSGDATMSTLLILLCITIYLFWPLILLTILALIIHHFIAKHEEKKLQKQLEELAKLQ